MRDNQKNVYRLKREITKACIKRGLNLAVHDGKIAFVDQNERKIIAVWTPEYSLSEGSEK